MERNITKLIVSRLIAAGLLAGVLISAGPVHAQRAAPLPGTEAALRKFVEGVASGKPDYRSMAPAMAEMTQISLDSDKARFLHGGALKSITFTRGHAQGIDSYEAVFERAVIIFNVSLDAEGHLASASYWPKP